ncbi:MAG: hypothetical protein ACRD1L_04195 [Terriglobales bacterium]
MSRAFRQPLLLALAAFAAGCLLLAAPLRADTYYVTVAGLGGEPDYVQRYTAAASALDQIFRQAGAAAHVTTLTGAAATRARLTQALQQVAAAAQPGDDFVLVLIGHGTYDGVEYKFNLPGPDLTAAELAALCDRIPARRQLIVDASECSGGALAALQKSGRRAVIVATKSGTEKNATVFARYFVMALQDPAADLDKNQAVSGLEAFQYAQRKVAEFYSSQKRLATEHAMDAEPALLASITLTRFGAAQRAYANPAKRALLAQKEELERKIDALNYQKDALSDDDYRNQMTALLLELAKLQQEIDK